MRYLYYPGCSLEGSAKEYDLSTRSFMREMGVDLLEIEGWTCCGATAAESVSRLLSKVLPARSLGLAEAMDQPLDVMVPCSSCYLNLKKVTEETRKDEILHKKINAVLAEEGLDFQGRLHVRHILDVISNDLGPEKIASRVTRHMAGLRIAPYYGCQCLRPYAVFDDPERPVSMESLIAASGAEVFSWEMGAVCCGASNLSTKPEVGIELVRRILEGAVGADLLLTVCPMCQMNLEAFQGRVSRLSGRDLRIPVLYLPQFMGLSLGLSKNAAGLGYNLSSQSFEKKTL